MSKSRKGRGARERILAAATSLFGAQGINATGMDELSDAANVSKRTVYTHFGSKDELIRAYLQHIEDDLPLPVDVLGDTSLPPRERLLAVFGGGFGDSGLNRGCAFINAAVEVPDPSHPAHVLAARNKLTFARRLAEVAREAGARDPQQLGDQLALLWDGAAARGMVLNTTATGQQARAAAAVLLDAAIPSPGPAA